MKKENKKILPDSNYKPTNFAEFDKNKSKKVVKKKNTKNK